MQVGRSLEVHLASVQLRKFYPLFQEGVGIEVETGRSIKQVLTEQLGIAPNYIAERISTIFLDSRAVDDVATALIRNGSVLALSGAMPGLVGATMRSGGYYAAMRGAMTFRNDTYAVISERGAIKIKLFNLLLEELGPVLLLHGLLLTAGRWKECLAQLPEEPGIEDCLIDGQPVPIDRFQCGEYFPDDGEVLRIKIQFGDG